MPHSKKEDPDWTPVHTPFEMDLFDVEHTVDGPYAIGASGTVVANRGEGWEVLVEAGPAAENSTLQAMDVTDDGERIWFVGASGVIGIYDVKEQRKYQITYNGDVTTTWQTVAVSGKTGSESVLLANGSGTIVSGEADGVEVKWKNQATPGSGASISAMAFAPDGVAYAVDSSGKAYKSSGPGNWTKIGIVNASANFHDIHAGANGRVYVAADDGSLYRYASKAKKWTPIQIATSALVSVDVFQNHIVVLTANSTFYWRTVDGQERWTRQTAPTGMDLTAHALGYPDVAVGKAGTVLRREPMQPPKPPEKHKEKEKGEHPDPKKKQNDTLVTCETLVKELIQRLTREELIELIEVRAGCESGIVEHLKEKKEERKQEKLEDLEVALLPVIEEELVAREGRERRERRGRREHSHRHECRGGRKRQHRHEGEVETELDLELLLDRIRTC